MDVGIHSLHYASQSYRKERKFHVGYETVSDLAGKFHLDFPQRPQTLLPHYLASQYQL
jgi:hypothetical protein